MKTTWILAAACLAASAAVAATPADPAARPAGAMVKKDGAAKRKKAKVPARPTHASPAHAQKADKAAGKGRSTAAAPRKAAAHAKGPANQPQVAKSPARKPQVAKAPARKPQVAKATVRRDTAKATEPRGPAVPPPVAWTPPPLGPERFYPNGIPELHPAFLHPLPGTPMPPVQTAETTRPAGGEPEWLP